MSRFFVSASNIFGGIAYISRSGAERFSALKVRDGEVITVCDGKGTDYSCRISDVTENGVEAELLGSAPSQEPEISCTVYTAFLQGGRLDYVVQKAVELGASSVVLFPSERCRSVPGSGSMLKLTARLNKIACTAAELAERGIVPSVKAAPSFECALKRASQAEAPLFCYEMEKKNSLRAALEKYENAKTFSIVTGPEDGFTPEEARLASEKYKMESVTLGKRVLMCDTAPVCALSAVMMLTNNL